MNLLSMSGVSKIYGPVKALDNIDLEVQSGEWLAIMGPSGSGKTTAMNIIGCLDSASEGSVVLDGQDLTKLDSRALTTVRREKIGLVFQHFHLVPHLSALENVMLAQYYHSMTDEAEALVALEKVGLGARAHHLPRQLSGGEQQRVCIARAMINAPMILLADEPTGNLDEKNEAIILDQFRNLHLEGHTIVMVTHDSEVGALADRCVHFEHGRVKVPSLHPS